MNIFLSLIKNLPIISLLPLVGAIINLVGFRCKVSAAKIFNLLIWLGFLLIFIIGIRPINSDLASPLFIANNLTIVISRLLFFTSGIVGSYSLRYMDGDSKFNRYFTNLGFLTFFLSLLFCANDLRLVLISWCFANFFLAKLMTHKSNWQQAKNGARLVASKLFLSSIALIVGFAILSKISNSYSITEIVNNNSLIFNKNLVMSLMLILFAALIQSGYFFFKSWLLNSANAPTPILAINAVAINSGIFILIRFAPLYVKLPNIMLLIFILGALSTLIGALWALVQNNIKHQLICSTIAQTGFVLMQYGLGLFYLALAHLFMHAVFKVATLLGSSSSLKETKIGYLLSDDKEISVQNILYSFIFATLGACLLIIITKINIFNLDSSMVPVIFVFMTATQISLPFVNRFPAVSLALTIIFALLYGFIISAFKYMLGDSMIHYKNLDLINIITLIIFVLIWLFSIKNRYRNIGSNKFSNLLYVWVLNSSRSEISSITATRKNYIY
jgi:NAD(P)H-quinone oxidoreductase subunit 5